MFQNTLKMSNLPNVQITSAKSIQTRIPSLASIYQAKKSGDNSVEVLKQKFQTDIEHKIQYVQQKKVGMPTSMSPNHDDEIEYKPHPELSPNEYGLSLRRRTTNTNKIEATNDHGKSNSHLKRHSIASPSQRPPLPPPLPPTTRNTILIANPSMVYESAASSANKGSETLRKLEREKSFEDARNAVQSQIEKIFQKQHGPRPSEPLLVNPEMQQNGMSQQHQMRRHDALIGMGTPILPGIFLSKPQASTNINKQKLDPTDLKQHENIYQRTSTNFRNQPLPPPPPPLPPNVPLHGLDILQKQMMTEPSIAKDHIIKPNMSSLSTRHRSMDSLATAKITTPETMQYMSPPVSPSRRNYPSQQMQNRMSRNMDYDNHQIYGQKEKVSHQSDAETKNIASRQESTRYRQNRKDVKEMRRSISHNSLAMRHNNQNQLHPLVQEQNPSTPFKLYPTGSEEQQMRKYHNLNSYYRPSEKQIGRSNSNSHHMMTSSYPSGAGSNSTMGPMSMFGDFSIDPLKKQLHMQFSHPEINAGNCNV